MTTGLVGRGFERSVLDGLLEAASSGRGQGVLVLGDAGIGKTTLVATFAADAELAGFTVGWGRCPESEAAPYWPWRQALRAIGCAGPVSQPAVPSRVSVFSELAEEIQGRAAETRTVLILEDVHLADAASLALVRFVTGLLPELPWVVVLTSRDNAIDLDGEAADTIAALQPAFVRMTLGGLTASDSANLVARVLGRSEPAIAADMFKRSGGNPFFLQELARLVAARGSAALGPPAGVRQVIGRRLARLRQQTHEWLVAAAVLGDDIDLRVLTMTLKINFAELLAGLAEAVDARLAVLDGDRLHFAHALVREVVYEGAPTGQLSQLHGSAAKALARSCCSAGTHVLEYGELPQPCCSVDRLNAVAGQVADHYRRAVGAADARQLAAKYSLAAARAAMRAAGAEQAVRFYRWAMEAGADDAVVQLEYGEALLLAGQRGAARDVLRPLARARLTAGDGELAARAVLAMGGGIGGFEVDLLDIDQVSLLRAALQLLPDGDSAVKAAALARLAVSSPEIDRTASQNTARHAVEIARRLGDVSAEVAAIAAWCDTASGPDFVRQRTTECRGLLDLATAQSDVTLELLARRLLVVALLEVGDFDTADRHIDAYARTSGTLRVPFYSWPVPIWRGMRALMRGDVANADVLLLEAEQLAAEAQSVNAELMSATLLLARGVTTGTLADHLELLRSTFLPFWNVPMQQCYLTFFLLEAGDRDGAEQMLAARAAEGVNAITRDAEWLPCITLMGDAARRLGRRDMVVDCYEAVRPYADLWLFDGIGAGCYGQVAEYIARFEEFLGRRRDPQTSKEEGQLLRNGAGWTVGWQGLTVTVADAKGVRDLAVLLSRPHTTVHVLDLVGADLRNSGGATDTLDQQARASYKSRLRELVTEIEDADDLQQSARAEHLRSERDFIARELAAALGLGGRTRLIGDPVERARKAVSMRVTGAIKAIEQVHPALGRHLRASVHTGRQCSYEPELDVTWHG